MNIRLTLPALAATGLIGVAACDQQPEVVQAPSDAVPAADAVTPVPPADAREVTALGMTAQELEGADVLSAENTDLGDVAAIIVDEQNTVTGFAVRLEGAGDRYVVAPVDRMSAVEIDGEKSLQTTLNARELAAQPSWDHQARPGAWSPVMAPMTPNAPPPATP